MKKKNRWIFSKKIKIYLVFFCVLSCTSCKKTSDKIGAMVDIEIISRELISFDYSGKPEDLSVALLNHSENPILGDWQVSGASYTFIPLLPLTKGESYEIWCGSDVLHSFTIALEDSNKKPTQLLAIYPTLDSVPENLLKMYFVFSNPMQETGNALNYIEVRDNQTNEKLSVFLELESELWNKDHTVLTLWLDPGRIKTDLSPNLERGLPIQNGHRYKIKISENWKDANNRILEKPYNKTLIVNDRDNKKPDISKWGISPPKKHTLKPLVVDFNEAIDYFLGTECFSVINTEKNIINGRFELIDKEHKLLFYPDSQWVKGKYSISVETRLEDLAGNNLNYVFDTDLKKDKPIHNSVKYNNITFLVE